MGSSYNGGTTAEQASWTNASASAASVYVLIFRGISKARAAYQRKVSY